MRDKNISVDDILKEVKSLKNIKNEPNSCCKEKINDQIIYEILTHSGKFKKQELDLNFLKNDTYDKSQTNFDKKSITEYKDIKESSSLDINNNIDINSQCEEQTEKEKSSLHNSNKDIVDVQADYQSEVAASGQTNEIKSASYLEFEQKFKLGIPKQSYIDLKQKRNDIVGEFVLETQSTQTLEMKLSELNQLEEKAEEEQTYDDETTQNEYIIDDFESYDQIDDISNSLKKRQKAHKRKIVFSGILSVFAVFLMLFKPSKGPSNIASMDFFGIFDISFSIYSVVNIVLLVLVSIVALEIIINGLNSIIKRCPEKDTLFFISFIFVAISSITVLINTNLLSRGISTYLPVFTICVFVNYISKYLCSAKAALNFKFFANAENKYFVDYVNDQSLAQNLTKGTVFDEPLLAKNTKAEFLNDFLFESFKQDKSDYIASKMLFFAVPLAFVIGFLAGYISKDVNFGIMAANGIVLTTISFVSIVVVSAPLYSYAKLNHKYGGMVAGGSCIDDFGDTNSLLIDAYDLFENDSVTLYGIKTFSGKRIDDAILDAASVICETKSILTGIFLNMIGEKKNLLRQVDSVVYEDLMGLSAWVDDRRVLIGNRELMLNHGIDVPSKDYEDRYLPQGNDLIYLSTAGQLTAVFVVGLKIRTVNQNFVRMLNRNKINIIIKTVDPMLTKDKLAEIFNVNPDLFKVLPSRLHKDFSEETKPKLTGPAIVANNGTFFGYAISLISAKKVKTCVGLGLLTQWCLIGLAVVLFTLFAFFNTLCQFGSLELTIYMCVWLAIYWILQRAIKF